MSAVSYLENELVFKIYFARNIVSCQAGYDGKPGPKGDKGDPGDMGVGIASIVANSDYTLTITLTNGNATTTQSLQGPSGYVLTPEDEADIAQIVLNSLPYASGVSF